MVLDGKFHKIARRPALGIEEIDTHPSTHAKVLIEQLYRTQLVIDLAYTASSMMARKLARASKAIFLYGRSFKMATETASYFS